MPGLLILLPIAVFIALGFLVFFLWSVRNGDFEDPEMPRHKMLLDDEDDVDHEFGSDKVENPEHKNNDE